MTDYQLLLPHAAWRAAVMPLLTGRAELAVGPLARDFSRSPLGLRGEELRHTAAVSGDDCAPAADWLVLTARDRPDWASELRPWRSQLLVVLAVGLGDRRAGWRGWCFEHGEVRPLAGFRVIGPGMLTVGQPDAEPADPVAWSRLEPAVGAGVFAKLRQASVAVVGASRLGTPAAFEFAALGVRRLVLVDADATESHNQVGMPGVPASAVGQPKVTALAAALTAFRPDLAVTALARPFAAVRDRLRDLDLLVTAVDADGPRLQAAAWARQHLTPHLDLGTGVTQVGAERLLAADVRLSLPTAGCLRCVGGLGDLPQAEYELHAPPGALPRRPPEAWHARGRLGSLPTLNATAAATGAQLWLDLLAGTLAGTTWVRLRWQPGVGWEQHSALADAGENCPICRPTGRQAA